MTTLDDIKRMLEAGEIAGIAESIKASDIFTLKEILTEVLQTINKFTTSTPLPPDYLAPLIPRLQELSKHSDETIRSLVLELSPHIEHPQTIEMLIERLGNEENLRLCRKAAEHLIVNIKQVTDYRLINALKSALFRSTGERTEIVLDVVSELDNREAIKDILVDVMRRWCPIMHRYCTDDIRPVNEYFVGHEFTEEKRDDLRAAINSAISQIFPDLKPWYADQELTGDIKCKICRKIRSSKFGIYDISEGCSQCQNPNPNVTWELGLAYGFGKPAILIVKKNFRIISNLASLDRIEYSSYKDLKTKMRAKIQSLGRIISQQ